MSDSYLFFKLNLIDNDWKITASRSVSVRISIDQLPKYCETILLKRLQDQFVVAFPQLRQLESFKITFVNDLKDKILLENGIDCLRVVMRNKDQYLNGVPISLFVQFHSELLKKEVEKYVISKACSECDKAGGPITGFIYACLQCPEHYLCSTCDANGKHPEHPIIRLHTTYPTPELLKEAMSLSSTLLNRWDAQKFGEAKEKINRDKLDHSTLQTLEHQVESLASKTTRLSSAIHRLSSSFNHYSDLSSKLVNFPERMKSKLENVVAIDFDKQLAKQQKKQQRAEGKLKKAEEKVSEDVEKMISMATGVKLKKKVDEKKKLASDFQQLVKSKWDMRVALQKETPVMGLKLNSEFEESPIVNKLVKSAEKKKEPIELISVKKDEYLNAKTPDVNMGDHALATGLVDKETAVAEETKLTFVVKTSDGKLDETPSKSPQRSDLEGWTIVSDENAATAELHSAATSIDLAEEEVAPLHPDPLVAAALEKMLNMGFSNEGGWLARLLEVKNGDVCRVLDVLNGTYLH